jgi:hypothetical protein
VQITGDSRPWLPQTFATALAMVALAICTQFHVMRKLDTMDSGDSNVRGVGYSSLGKHSQGQKAACHLADMLGS